DEGFTYELRDAQFYTLRTVPHTGMAIGVDLGDEQDIHPPNKLPLALRLARLALAIHYGCPWSPTGPLYRMVHFSNGRATVYFDYAEEGLVARGDSLNGFTIAGADEVFHPAQATINGSTVVVEAESVPKPVAVRYAWSNTPSLSLWTKGGLPAAPFRTDNFPLHDETEYRPLP
ncbi:MAG: 9-O-acetylesterase, partial [Verrucomicrobiia bacterium]